MTDKEKDLYRSDDFERAQMTPVTKTRIGKDGKTYQYTSYAQKGVKITVKRKDNEEISTSAATESDARQGETAEETKNTE